MLRVLPLSLALAVPLSLALALKITDSGSQAAPDGASQARQRTAIGIAVNTAHAAAREPKVAQEKLSQAKSLPPLSPTRVASEEGSLRLLGLARETPIYARPSKGAPKIGYVRTGTSLVAKADKERGTGCAAGWYAVRPFGFVCADERVSVSTEHPVSTLATQSANRLQPLPYTYALVKRAGVPLYTRIPSTTEREALEGSGAGKLTGGWQEQPVEPLPPSLAAGHPTPTLHGYARPASTLYSERALDKGSFAVTRLFEVNGQRFGLTPDLLLLPLDRATPVVPSSFRGIKLSAKQSLPVAMVRARAAYLYSIDEANGSVRLVRRLDFREGLVASSEKRQLGGKEYVRSEDGFWFRSDQVSFIQSSPEARAWVKREPRFIDISLKQQSLVAYERGRPVFATLISSGLESEKGEGAPRATVTGEFRIHTKHVTAPMKGDDPGDEYSLPDVPYVQYFHGSFALHAAYWHERFGSPQSHGCVNLSPEDARFLFGWTDPPVPQGWHGAMDSVGTLVSIHD